MQSDSEKVLLLHCGSMEARVDQAGQVQVGQVVRHLQVVLHLQVGRVVLGDQAVRVLEDQVVQVQGDQAVQVLEVQVAQGREGQVVVQEDQEILEVREGRVDILKERKEATIDEIVAELSDRIGKITAVTVRHHLEILRGDGLVGAPTVRRRSAPGRPQYVYSLTDRAADMFPNNYQGLASGLLEQIKGQLPAEKVNDILGGIAENMIAAAMVPDAPIEIRLDHVVAFLNNNGYTASWSRERDGHTLSVINCPYEQISCSNAEVCQMDKKMIEGLIGVPTRRVSWRWEDKRDACVYVVENGR